MTLYSLARARRGENLDMNDNDEGDDEDRI